MATEAELIAVVKGDIKDFVEKMNKVNAKLNQTSGLVDKSGKTISSSNSATVASNTKVQESYKKTGLSLSKLAGYAAAAWGVIQGGKAIIESSAKLSDKWNVALAGLNGGLQAIFRSIANMDFSNFFSNIEKAMTLSRELEERRNELENATRSLSIQESEYATRISALKLIASDEDVSNEKKIEALKEAKRLTEELRVIQLATGKEAYNIAMDKLIGDTELNKSQIENFLRYYNNQKEIREEAQKYLQLLKDEAGLIGAPGIYAAEELTKVQKAIYETSDEVKIYAAILEKHGETSKKVIDDASAAWINMNGIIGKSNDEVTSLNKSISRLTPNATAEAPTHGTALGGKSISPLGGGILPVTGVMAEQLRDLSKSLEGVSLSFEEFSETVRIATTTTFDAMGNKIGEMKMLVIDLGQELKYLATDVLVGLAESFGEAFAGANFKEGAEKMLLQIADWAQRFGALLIAAAVASKTFQKSLATHPVAAFAAGVALVAVASWAKASLAKRPGASDGGSMGSSGSDNSPMNYEGFRNLRQFQVSVTGQLVASGSNLVAVISNEGDRTEL